MNQTHFLQSIANSTGVKALELGGIKVWFTLGSEGRFRIPIEDAEIDESACKAEGKLYFQYESSIRYGINIQSDNKPRLCKVYSQSPSGRVVRIILKRNLMQGIPEYRQRKGSAQYHFNTTNTGGVLATAKATTNSSMGIIVVTIREDLDIIYTFTFKLQHFVKKQDYEESTSEMEDDTEILSSILGNKNHTTKPKVPLLTWKDNANPDVGHRVSRISRNIPTPLKFENDCLQQFQERASKKRKRSHSSHLGETSSVGKVETESENELDGRLKKADDPAKKRLCILLDKCKEEIMTVFKF